MNILLVHPHKLPVRNYGGTERVVWYLGKELAKLGHNVSFLTHKDSTSDFANIIPIDTNKNICTQIPAHTDFVHFHFPPTDISAIKCPYVITMHGNEQLGVEIDPNTIFVSQNHAQRYGSQSYVHNGLDWDDFGEVNFVQAREYFHFLGKAAWRVKNVRGAIGVIKKTQKEQLHVLGGTRFNFNMGIRLTTSPRIHFHGMVSNQQKNKLINKSKGLIFPVRWHEPFGLAIIESLYFGCPVFGSPYGALPELVPPDVGFLSSKSQELCGAVMEKTFSANHCHNYAVENFNSKNMALSYLHKYEIILAGHKLNLAPPMLINAADNTVLPWD